MGLYEIHSHTKEVSRCSKVSASELVDLHLKADLDGVCITDHYHREFYNSYKGLGDTDIIDKYLSGYRKAHAIGKKKSLRVFWGMEIRLNDSSNDYLLYGVTEDFLYKNPRIFNLSLVELSECARKNSFFLAQAHPFRDFMKRIPPKLLDGIESINGNPRHISRNKMSISYAEKHGLQQIGGSDFHRDCDVNLVITEINNDISSNSDLAECLLAGNFNIVDNR